MFKPFANIFTDNPRVASMYIEIKIIIYKINIWHISCCFFSGSNFDFPFSKTPGWARYLAFPPPPPTPVLLAVSCTAQYLYL
jgi:hypothetical protein